MTKLNTKKPLKKGKGMKKRSTKRRSIVVVDPVRSLKTRLCAAEGNTPCEDLGFFRCGRRPLGCMRTIRGCRSTGMCDAKKGTSPSKKTKATCRRMLNAAIQTKDKDLIAEVRLVCDKELAAGGRLANIMKEVQKKGMLVAGKAGAVAAKVAPVLAGLAVKIASKVAMYATSTTLEILKHLFEFAFRNPNCFTRAFAAVVCRNKRGAYASNTTIGVSLNALCALFDWVVCAMKDHVLPRLPVVGAFISVQLVTTSGASCKTFVASNRFQTGMRAVYAYVRRKGVNQIMRDVGLVYVKFGMAVKTVGAVGAGVGAGVAVPAAAVMALGAAAANFTFSVGKEIAEDFVENPYGCPAKAWMELFKKIGRAVVKGGPPLSQMKKVEVKILSTASKKQLPEAKPEKSVLRLPAP